MRWPGDVPGKARKLPVPANNWRHSCKFTARAHAHVAATLRTQPLPILPDRVGSSNEPGRRSVHLRCGCCGCCWLQRAQRVHAQTNEEAD